MFRRIWPVFLFELRAILSKRGFQITTIAFPLLGIILVGVMRFASSLGGDAGPQMSGYVDRWGKLPREAPAELSLQAYPTEDAAQQALLVEAIAAYYVIPEDYVQTGLVRQYRTAEGGIFDEGQSPAALRALLIQSLVRDAVEPAVTQRVLNPVRIDTVRLTPTGDIAPAEKDSLARFLVPYLFGVLLTTSLMMSAGFLVQSVAEEKQSRTIEVLLSSVSSTTLMTGKILGLGTAGLLQIILWLTMARFLASFATEALGLPTTLTVEPTMIVVGVIFFILGYLFYATILAGVGSMATTPQEGGQLAGFINLAAIIPFFLITYIIENPDATLSRVFTYVPFTAPLTVMLRLSAADIPWLDIIGSMVVLALATAGALALSARIFRAYLLLYGQRPGLGDVIRTLRSAR